MGVIHVHANGSKGRDVPAVAARQERANAEEEHGLETFRAVGANMQVDFVGGSDVDQERHEPGGKDDDEQDAPPSGEAGPSAPKRSTKKATKATGGRSTKKATKAIGGSSTKKVDTVAEPEEPPKDSAEGERYTQADCALLILVVNDADPAMARILNRTEKIDKVWTFVREGSARSRQCVTNTTTCCAQRASTASPSPVSTEPMEAQGMAETRWTV
eukprot:jgi/Tetstr1/442845/TSEL_003222.t1